MKRTTLFAILFVVAALAVVIAGYGIWRMQSAPAPTFGLATTASVDAGAQAQTGNAGNAGNAGIEIPDMALGLVDAPITMIEYASFTCPHCGDFHNRVFDDLKADYIDTGQVRFIFREVYFDRFGLWASIVARCAGEEHFFAITDLLFERQAQWARAGDPTAIAAEIRKTGRLAGLEDAALETCLADQQKAESLIAWYQKNASADNVTSTPTFVINGRQYSNRSYEELRALLDGLL
ncbi:MAG: DsbA family protein [Rhodobacteraceae bacterium]|nr:DsbA family protein [Paracoccaceae bacterium]